MHGSSYAWPIYLHVLSIYLCRVSFRWAVCIFSILYNTYKDCETEILEVLDF